MTGLDSEKDVILELAYILTDKKMNEIARDEYIFHHTKKKLSKMNPWCTAQHTKSGLIEKVIKSKTAFQDAETNIMNVLQRHTIEKETYFAGNSVYIDALFIKKQFPNIYAWMHYRLFDITTFKIEQIISDKPLFEKKESHRATDDINESIAEYLCYKKERSL
jgi:oligoribonuclease